MSAPLLLSYYGDDFTGSTDVMEALTTGGVETVLFTRLPDEALRARFAHCQAIGLAGTSRSQNTAWMESTLPGAFAWLRDLGARFCHYKVCSTFDSAPDKGSIGRALEIGLRTFAQKRAAIVVGAPQLRRFTTFGTLFAAYQGKVYRIDRHPVMQNHPATPMDEADLLFHLSKQTPLPLACITPEDLDTYRRSGDCSHLDEEQGPAAGVLIDVYDATSQAAAGAILEEHKDTFGPFVAGSSGLEYALLTAWQQQGLAQPPEPRPPLEPKERIAVVSGSCSPTTGTQIQTALQNNFAGIKVDYASLAGGMGLDAEVSRALDLADKALTKGQSPLLYTADGTAGPAPSLSWPGATTSPEDPDRVGQTLGRLLAALTKRHGLDRIAVAGGDTSSHALSELAIAALTLRTPLPASPGSPVCTAHRTDGTLLDIALKGGQIGTDRYFVDLRDGLG